MSGTWITAGQATDPLYWARHCRETVRYAEALAEFKRGHDMGSKNPNWRYPSAEWVRQAERLVDLDRKLPTILAGKAKPSDAAETLGFAQLCYDKKLHSASARLWSEAFQAQPKLAEDMQADNRYNAACAAALAGSGHGKDDPVVKVAQGQNLAAQLEKAGINYHYTESTGGHTWSNWRIYLNELAPSLFQK